MLCPPGFYCALKELKPTACPLGTFSRPGAMSIDNCTACLDGYYCIEGSAVMYDCLPGYYCSNGTKTACPEGTFNGQSLGVNITNCSACPSGALCNTTGIVDPNDWLCPPGYYCPRGSTTPIICPAGTYRSTRGGSSK